MKYLIIFSCLLSFTIMAQSSKTPIKKEFPFGKYWSFNRTDKRMTLDDVDVKYTLDGIVYEDTTYFQRKGSFDQNKFQMLLNDKIIAKIFMVESAIDAFLIPVEGLNKFIDLMNCKFNFGFTSLGHAVVQKPIFLNGAEIKNTILLIDVTFIKGLSIRGGIIKGRTDIINNNFKDDVNFREIRFDELVWLSNCTFEKSFTLGFSTFDKGLDISDTRFTTVLWLNSIKMNRKPDFSKVIFPDTLYLMGGNYLEGVDFRRCNFSKTKAIYMEEMKYPDGKLFINWEQIQSASSPKIKIYKPSNDNEDNYNRLVVIYEKLRDNYLAQGNKTDADNVMYELAEYKNQLLGGFWHTLYGWVLGYGYKPWKFLIIWILPVLLMFAFIWYWGFYGIVRKIVSPNFDRDFGLNVGYSIEIPAKTIKLLWLFPIKVYDHNKIKPSLNIIVRLWHVIYFSATVMLSIRFKKEWITDHYKKDILGIKYYMAVVTFEWFIGIISYIIFAVFVLGNQFGYIKGLLGF